MTGRYDTVSPIDHLGSITRPTEGIRMRRERTSGISHIPRVLPQPLGNRTENRTLIYRLRIYCPTIRRCDHMVMAPGHDPGFFGVKGRRVSQFHYATTFYKTKAVLPTSSNTAYIILYSYKIMLNRYYPIFPTIKSSCNRGA